MPREARAILFDLDDTLFSHRRFRLSGFAAVARAVASSTGLDARALFGRMVAAARNASTYGREFDEVITAFSLDLPKERLIAEMREHEPNITLHKTVRRTLCELRASFRLAIVTNGFPGVQQSKLRALGLLDAVDAIVYATEHGSGRGKPERAPFVEALKRLGVEAGHAVFVGDDEHADIYGAARCGLRTIQTRQWRRRPLPALATVPDATVTRLADVPSVAQTLLSGRPIADAA